MTVRERILRKKEYIKSLIFAMDECNSMFFKDCMVYLIEIKIKEIKELKRKLRQVRFNNC
jgi:hypothetical protein